MLLVCDAILGEVSHDYAVVLTRVVHNPLKHIPIGLLLMSVWEYSWDGVLEFDRRLNLLHRDCQALRGATSITFLFLCVDHQASILFVPWLTID